MQPEILRPRDVLTLLRVSKTTLWRLRRQAGFPQPIQLGPPGSRLFGWRRADVEEWLDSRPAA